MLPDAWLWSAIAAIVIVSILALRVWRTITRERSARVAAERAAAQSYRLAQSTAAFGYARTSADAMTTAIHDRRTLTVASVVGYSLDERDEWTIEDWGGGSPVSESLRRLTPVVVKSKKTRPAEHEPWSSAGPWRNHEAYLVLPIVIERQRRA